MHTATYSPEDNKLRLYPAHRLGSDEYAAVKAAGFIWAPKQELFVAPTWTPSREDFLLKMCEEIGDEDTSLVDRAEAKAERLENLSERKTGEAERAHKAVHAIADNIPFGQPILIGHHSEKHARKDAQRIENGMRKAVDCWKAAEYWKDRAAGAVRLAKYKERPDVRARRIKGLEADKRKLDKSQGEALTFIKLWSHENMTWAFAKRISNDGRCHISRCYTLAEFPRELPRKQYEGEMGLWSALGDTPEEGVISAEQAAEFALRTLRGRVASAERWITHLENRLTYERAMLAESGGLHADRFEFAIGGRVLARGEWATITKLNKSGETLVSVTTNARYCRIKSLEEITGYEAPTAEQAEATKAAVKAAPLCNYPRPDFATCTEAEWKEIPSDYRSSTTLAATETAAAHRVRYAIGFRVHKPAPTGKELEPGFCAANRTHSYWPVFVTDAKRKDPPAIGLVPPTPPPVLAPARRALPRTATSIDSLTVDMFTHNEESGKIRAGIKWINSTDGGTEAECYQFDTLAELQECARAYQQLPIMVRFSIVTHSGQYQNMRTLYTWESPLETARKNATAENIRNLQESLKAGIKVAVVPQLFPTPPDLAARVVQEAGIQDGHRILEPEVGTGQILGLALHNGPSVEAVAVEINAGLVDMLRTQQSAGAYPGATFLCADFLEQNGNLGKFDRILMNPPFQNGVDIKHIQHAINFLKPGGRLVALCANGSRQRDTLKPIAENSGGWWEDLPAGSFLEQGTNVNVALLVIEN